jgi:hypothetical protein
MYNKIYDFCKVRNLGNVFSNDRNTPTPRVQFIINLLEDEKINYQLDKFTIDSRWKNSLVTCYNIILKGTSDKMVAAHHDVSNHKIDNANDNSASVINAIMIKKLRPDIHVVILDGEEYGGMGSQRVSEQINNGEYGDIRWVLNLELSGKGGKSFFIGSNKGNLFNHIKKLFNCVDINVPFNDSVIFRSNNIDSVVINPAPKKENGQLDLSLLYNCHTSRDTVDTICINDMKEFVEEIVLKILE